ncbi:MAG: Ig-like domain-containing protein [Bacilli bacterium]|nr:Ig-like domain-containing protein [Bacilli bacterium]
MKNIFKVVTAALGVFCLASCGENVSKTNEVNFPGIGYGERDFVAIKDLNQHIVVGEKAQIPLDVMPANYSSKIVFESKNPSVVTVSDSGEMTAIAKGKTMVYVKTSDGALIGKVNVLVSKGDDSDVESTINSIKATYNDSSYVAPTKAHKREFSHEIYYQNGKVDHSYVSTEEIYFDVGKCYFMVSSDDIQTYTVDGGKEISSGKWIFQVQGMKLRMIHITDIAKTYLDFNIADPKYDDPVESIYDVLDMFFVQGRKIANDLLEDYSGKKDFMLFAPGFGSSGYEFHTDGNNNLFIGEKFSQQGRVETEDELDYLDMREGTTYTDTEDYKFFFDGASCSGYTIGAVYDYKVDNVPWKRDFLRSMQFDVDYQIEEYKALDDEMKLAGWTKVTNLYDL